MKKYRTDNWSYDIEVVDCVKETEKTLFINNGYRIMKTSKETRYEKYHDTEIDAINYLINRGKGKIKRNEEEIKEVLSDVAILQKRLSTVTSKIAIALNKGGGENGR